MSSLTVNSARKTENGQNTTSIAWVILHYVVVYSARRLGNGQNNISIA